MSAAVWILIAILIIAVVAVAMLRSRGRRRGGVIATSAPARNSSKDAEG